MAAAFQAGSVAGALQARRHAEGNVEVPLGSAACLRHPQQRAQARLVLLVPVRLDGLARCVARRRFCQTPRRQTRHAQRDDDCPVQPLAFHSITGSFVLLVV